MKVSVNKQKKLINLQYFFSLVVLSVIYPLKLVHSQERLIIKGSDTIGAKLMPKLAEAYANKNPEIKFEIAAEGSSTGISAIIEGTADIAMSSREIKPKELAAAGANGIRLKSTLIANDAVVIVVNELNPIHNVSSKDLERIFSGDVTNWSSIGGKSGRISVYTRNTSSGTYSFVQKNILSNRDYGEETQKLAGNEFIVEEISKNINSIGYTGLAYANLPGIKLLSVDGKLPNLNSSKNDYVLTRGLTCLTKDPANLKTLQFLTFLKSQEACSIIINSGFGAINWM